MDHPTPDADGVGPDDVEAARARDARWVQAALDGDPDAFGRLYDAWFDRVHHLALGIVRDPEVAAELAQDAFLSAWKNLPKLEDHHAFGGWLLRIARNGSLNRSTRERRSHAVDDQGLAVIESSNAGAGAGAPAGFGVEDRLARSDDPAVAAEDGEVAALVHEAAGALGERDAEVLDLQLRLGLSPAEVGEVLGMNRNAANQLCHRIRKRFATAVAARVLWRGGRPACDELDALLRSAGVERFDAEAVKIADRHAEGCDRCSERRELRLQPAALFASVPIVAAPVLVKQQAAGALEAAGVPMGGSSFAGSTPTSLSAPSGDGGSGSSGTTGSSGSSDAGAVVEVHESEDAPTRRSGRARRAAALSVAAGVVLLLAVVLLASRAGDGTVDDEVAVADADSTSSQSSTAPSTTPSTVAIEPAPETTPGIVVTPDDPAAPPSTVPPSIAPPPPPVAPPAPPPVIPPPVLGISLTPATANTAYYFTPAVAPQLQWEATGARAVRIEGYSGGQRKVLSTAAAGQLSLCPGTTFSAGPQVYCQSNPGTYEYALIVEGEDGQTYTKSVVLTIA